MKAITTPEQINRIIDEARIHAYAAAQDFFLNKMDGVDGGSCGFAWVNIYKYDGKDIKGNTKIGRALKAAGVEQDYRRKFQIWNPSGYPVQNIDTLEAGARAAAEVFKRYGFEAYMGSRLD